MVEHGVPRHEIHRDESMTKGLINYVDMIYGVESLSIGLSALSLHTVPTSSSISTDFDQEAITTTVTKGIIF